MNYTETIMNYYDLPDAYKIYAAISRDYEEETDSETILSMNTEEINIDREIFINTLSNLEKKESIIIDLMMQTLYNDKLKKQIQNSHDGYYDYYMDIYKECVKCYYDLEVIGQYLIKLAIHSHGDVDSELVNKILCNNIDFQYMIQKDEKYYGALAYKLQAYDIVIKQLSNSNNINFLKSYAKVYDLKDYTYEKINNTYVYDYLGLQYLIDEMFNINDAISRYIDYDQIIYDMELEGSIIPLRDTDTYINSDLFLYEVE